MASLSSRDKEELCSMIDKAVIKLVGHDNPDLTTSALNCILKGYDRKKTERMYWLFKH